MSELWELDATAQAEVIASGQASAREVVDAAIERIEQLDPTINAVIHRDFDRARTAADNVVPGSAPFAGVPFLIKDIGATQEGLPYWLGNRALKAMNNQSQGDTELGRRFRDAGLITLGKTNLPELGSSPTTQPKSFGPTNNPWDLDRSPAGSSGGSAAAVAARMVPIAHANDGGGSTRLPAAWCGLVGLKTSRGRVPNPLNASRLTSELVVTRTVRDTARLLDAVEGAVEADLFHLPRPERSYESELAATSGPLKIAMVTDGGLRRIDEECVVAVEQTAATLEAMGHEIVSVPSDVLLGGDSTVNGQLWMAGLARRVDMLGDYAGRPLTEGEVDPYNWTAALRGREMSASQWAVATEKQQAWAVEVVDWMADFDVVLTPTAGCPPLRTSELEPPVEKPWKISSVYALVGLFTLPFNVTGQPAISLPLHETPQGLPVGVQLVAHMGREDLLMQLSAQLEQANPWIGRAPVF